MITRAILAALAIFSGPLLAQKPPLSPADQDHLLDQMHSYSDNYVSGLPNFLCEQVTREFDAGENSNHWHKGDTLVSTLRFNEEGEHRTLDQINGKPVKPGARRRLPLLSTEGEFGILLSQVLGQESHAYFSWNRWETVRGKEFAVFNYSVDKEHSTIELHRSGIAKAIIPYNGFIFADPSTGVVWRISSTATDIPEAIKTRQISTVIDYDEIPIGDKNTFYL